MTVPLEYSTAVRKLLDAILGDEDDVADIVDLVEVLELAEDVDRLHQQLGLP